MLAAAFDARYPGDSPGLPELRQAATAICQAHLNDGLGDPNMLARLCNTDTPTYWQAMSEVLVARQLRGVGLHPTHANAGPDFLLEVDSRRIWIEVICPTPTGIPPAWLTFMPGVVQSMPHEAMLLRWTAAIKEKSEKLIGPQGNPQTGYLANGLVSPDDAYVIAVNGRLLRAAFSELLGISGFPFAAEATYSIGPYQITINTQTMEATGGGHQHRPRIPKPNGAQVPADTFLDPRFAPISAIWATDMDENALRDRAVPMAVVHNPLATQPIPLGLLPAQKEFHATSVGEFYRIDRENGRLAADEVEQE